MKHRAVGIGVALGLLSSVVACRHRVRAPDGVRQPSHSAARRQRSPRAVTTPSDVLGDPWDFSNDEDVPADQLIGPEDSFGIARDCERDAHGRRRERHDGQVRSHMGTGAAVGSRRPAASRSTRSIYSAVHVRLFLPVPRDIGSAT